jgi:hypothetical protein
VEARGGHRRRLERSDQVIPGSKLRKLEAITGLQVAGTSTGRAHALFSGDCMVPVAISHKVSEADIADDLRAQNWKIVCDTVFRKQGWRCAECGKTAPLQGHHVLFRSRWRREDGPLDVVTNVRGLCARCHETEHGRGKKR